MNLRHGQRGITMWGIGVIVLVGLFFLFLFFKLFPPYMEDAQVASAIDAFATSYDARTKAPPEVIEAIEKRLDIENVKGMNARKDIVIVPDGNTYAIEAKYVVEVPMMGNVSVLLDFNHRVVVR